MSLKSFLNGVAYGFILGVLFAPTSGEETRRRIAKKAADIRDSVKEKYNDIADTVGEQYSSIKEKINDIENDSETTYKTVRGENAGLFE